MLAIWEYFWDEADWTAAPTVTATVTASVPLVFPKGKEGGYSGGQWAEIERLKWSLRKRKRSISAMVTAQVKEVGIVLPNKLTRVKVLPFPSIQDKPAPFSKIVDIQKLVDEYHSLSQEIFEIEDQDNLLRMIMWDI